MVKVDTTTIENLTRLSRIKCTEEECHKLATDLSHILDYVSALEEADTADVAPLSYIFEEQVAYMREDEICESLSREEFLSIVPEKRAGLVLFPEVLKPKDPSSPHSSS